MIRDILSYILGSVLVKTINKGQSVVKKHKKEVNKETKESNDSKGVVAVKNKRKTIPWTIEEVNYLRANYDSSSIQEMSTHLNRTPEAIKSKLRRMRKRSSSYWDKDEDEFLVLNYSIKSPDEIARKLGRSVPDVKSRIESLELHREH